MASPRPFHRTNLYLGIGELAAALLIALVWVALDTTTGLVEKVRRQTSIGGALAAIMAAVALAVGGVLVLLLQAERFPSEVTGQNLRFLGLLLAIFAVGFLLMRWGGPLAVAIAETFGGPEPEDG